MRKHIITIASLVCLFAGLQGSAQSIVQLYLTDSPTEINDFVIDTNGILLLQDAKGTIWESTGYQTTKANSEMPPHVRVYNPMLDTGFIDVYEDQGKIFATTSDFIYLYQSNSWSQYHVPEFNGLLGFNQVAYGYNQLAFSIHDQLYIFHEGTYDYRKYNLPDEISQLSYHNQRLYILSGKKIYQLTNTTSDSDPKFAIDQVLVNGKNASLPLGAITTSDNLVVILHLQDISRPADVLLHYSLDDQQTWTPLPRVSDTVLIPQLPEGQHKLQLRLDYGANRRYTQSINLTVHQEGLPIWVYLLLAGILGLLLGAIMLQWYSSSTLAKLRLEGEKSRTESKLITSEQQKLSLQMSPHFLFNALNSIQGLLATEDSKSARKHLQNFSLLMRSTLDMSRDTYTTVGSEVTYLTRYLKVHQLIKQQSFTYHISHEGIDEDQRIPALITQPIVENAIIHGLKGRTDGHIKIIYRQVENKLTCTISDNGVGFMEKVLNTQGHKSAATSIIKSRLASELHESEAKVLRYLPVDQGTSVNLWLAIIN